MSRIIKEVTQNVHHINKELVQFQHVELLNSCLRQLNKDMHNAKIIYNDEQVKLTQKPTKVSKRPMSPLSPMVNSLQYDPLPQMGYIDDHSNRPREFDLDEKFDNLDLDCQVLPTPVPYPNQTTNTQTPNSRNQGDMIDNNQFDTGNVINPTPAGAGTNARPRMRNNSGGGGGDDNDPDSRNNNNRDSNGAPFGFPGRGPNGPGGNGPPGGPGDNPPSGGYPGAGYWNTGIPFPGYPGGPGGPGGPPGHLGPDGNPGVLYVPYPYVRPKSPPLIKLPDISRDAYWWDGDSSTLKSKLRQWHREFGKHSDNVVVPWIRSLIPENERWRLYQAQDFQDCVDALLKCFSHEDIYIRRIEAQIRAYPKCTTLSEDKKYMSFLSMKVAKLMQIDKLHVI